MSTRRVPLEKRKRTEASCDKCKARKQKCHRKMDYETCTYCHNHGIQCVTTQARKTRIYGSMEGLGLRISLLESLVKGLVPEANLSDLNEMRELGLSLGIPLPQQFAEETKPEPTAQPVKQEEELRVDQQGQSQYIGPSSSFSFHVKLRTLFGRNPSGPKRFLMFGSNAADKREDLSLADRQALEVEEEGTLLGSTPSQDATSPGSVDGSVLDALVACFFDQVQVDFPILHEASFREAFEHWTHSPAAADPAWLCSLLCVLILARRAAPFQISEKHETKWWRQVQDLLPTVLFTSSLTAVQALILAALHLHNNSHRDACWTLTGSAVRIAYAIGLHRDGLKSTQTPLIRELRKQVWWTLYGFELMQVSSHDRPSAIHDESFSVGTPRESILGGSTPPDYTTWSNRLTVMLGKACRTSGLSQVTDDMGPLSPTARLLRDLEKWKQSLPPHLGLDVVNTLAPTSQRQILLMHIRYHYTVSLITRSALLGRATVLSKNWTETLPPAALTMSDSCIESGRLMCQLLLKLESVQMFNCTTWFDIYFTFSSSLILVLDLICNLMQDGEAAAGSQRLLNDISECALRQKKKPNLAVTMEKWVDVVTDFGGMVQEFISSQPTSGTPMAFSFPTPNGGWSEQPALNRNIAQASEVMNANFATEGDEMIQDPAFSQFGGQTRWNQLSFLDPESSNFWQEVHWDDIGSILLNDQQRGG